VNRSAVAPVARCERLGVSIAAVVIAVIVPLAWTPSAGGTTVASGSDLSIPAEGPAVVKARTAALLMSEMSGGVVRTSVLALPGTLPDGGPEGGEARGGAGEDTGGARRPVWIKVEIDAAGLLADEVGVEPADRGEGGTEGGGVEPGETIPVEVFLYALGRDSEVVDAFTVRFALDAAVRGELLAGRGLAVAATLELPPGESRLRHLVWSEPAGRDQRFGLGGTTVTVPSSDPPSVLWIPERPDRWMWVRPRDGAAEAWMPTGSVPASLPVLTVAEGAAGEVVAWWRTEAKETRTARERLAAPSREGTVQLEPEGPGRPEPLEVAASAVEVPYDVLDRRGDGRGGEVVRVGFAVPEVAPGRYRLILRPRDGTAPLPLPVVVASPGAGEVWPRVLPAVPAEEGEDPSAAPPSSVPQSPAVGRRTVAQGPGEDEAGYRRDYRTVVARLAGGDPEGAAAELARLEAEALQGLEDGNPDAALLRLVEVQRETAAELLGPEAEGAPALALLHAGAARHHFRASRWLLADRAVEQAVWLAEGHAAIRDTRQARRDAAGLLVWLAADLRQAGRGTKARDMFRRSLDLEETDAALLGLATLEERSGDVSEAVATLERLVERDPAHREAQLRLAVNLIRLGRTDRARDLLRRLVRSVSSSWVAVVAFEELARIDLGRGDCVGAVRVLRRALDHFPDQPQLAVQLAWALECAGERVGSREVAARIVEQARRGASDGVCPRTRYTRWSEETLEPERRRLGELARQSRQALTASLGGLGAGR